MVVRDYLKEFYDELQTHVSEVATKEAHEGELSQAFKVISNRVVIAREISDDYMKRLSSPVSPLSEDQVTQRLKYVYRDLLFVGTMSTIEYYFIQSLLLYPELDATKKIKRRGERKVHLSNLIVWAKDMLDDFYLWDFCIKLRNDIVHFDAIARQSMESPDISYPVIMRQGKQASGLLRSFISLSWVIENGFFKFIMNLL